MYCLPRGRHSSPTHTAPAYGGAGLTITGATGLSLTTTSEAQLLNKSMPATGNACKFIIVFIVFSLYVTILTMNYRKGLLTSSDS